MNITRRSFHKLVASLTMSALVGGYELRFIQSADAISIIGTSTWGAEPATEPITLIDNKPIGIVIHHTESQNSTTYTVSHAQNLARIIQHSHIYERGWIDSGHHFLVSRGGYVLEGRHRSLEAVNSGTKHCIGAHSGNFTSNQKYVGIECEGTYMTQGPTSALYNQVVTLCAFICLQYGINPTTNIIGHRDLVSTSCPGDVFYGQLPQLRNDVLAAMGGSTTPPASWPVIRQGDTNRRVTAAEYLLRHRGYSITVDGYFDSKTTSETKKFQTSKNLVSDGIIGAATWNALILTVRRGDNNNAVRAIQSLLQITADGAFGPGTETAVKNLQTSKGLVADGIVGPNTWNAAVNLPV